MVDIASFFMSNRYGRNSTIFVIEGLMMWNPCVGERTLRTGLLGWRDLKNVWHNRWGIAGSRNGSDMNRSRMPVIYSWLVLSGSKLLHPGNGFQSVSDIPGPKIVTASKRQRQRPALLVQSPEGATSSTCTGFKSIWCRFTGVISSPPREPPVLVQAWRVN